MRREDRLDNGDMSKIPLQPLQSRIWREERLDNGDKVEMPLQPRHPKGGEAGHCNHGTRREERLDNGDTVVMPLQPQHRREERLDNGDRSEMPSQRLQSNRWREGRLDNGDRSAMPSQFLQSRVWGRWILINAAGRTWHSLAPTMSLSGRIDVWVRPCTLRTDLGSGYLSCWRPSKALPKADLWARTLALILR